jgi:CheY-like chemotaxis protein
VRCPLFDRPSAFEGHDVALAAVFLVVAFGWSKNRRLLEECVAPGDRKRAAARYVELHDDERAATVTRFVAVLAEASDGNEALAATRTHNPDVVPMDVRMPNLDGIDAARQLVESGSRARAC